MRNRHIYAYGPRPRCPVAVVARTINALSERRIKEVTQRCPTSRARAPREGGGR